MRSSWDKEVGAGSELFESAYEQGSWFSRIPDTAECTGPFLFIERGEDSCRGGGFIIQVHLDTDPGEYKVPFNLALLEAGLWSAVSISALRSPLIMVGEENSAGCRMPSKKA